MDLKKIVAVISVICILFSFTPSFAKDYVLTRREVCDMLLEAADFYNSSITKNDIIKGYEDGLLHEERKVTRAEALVMLHRAFGSFSKPKGHNERVALKSEKFTDIPVWAKTELQDIFECGIVGGVSDGIFSPHSYVTKKQMQLFIERVYSLLGLNLKDDFYAAVNKESLEKTEITKGNVIAGPIYNMQQKIYEKLGDTVRNISYSKDKKGSIQQKIGDYYNSITDIDSRNKVGIAPLKVYLEKIESAKNISELAKIHTLLVKELCVDNYISFHLTRDINNSEKYMTVFAVMTPRMNKEVYTRTGAYQDAYKEYIKTLLILSGEEEGKAERNMQEFFNFEKILAENMLPLNQLSDIEKTYNLYSYKKLCTTFPDFDMAGLLDALLLEKEDKILIEDISLTECFAKLYNQENFNCLKTAAKISVLDAWGETLCSDFFDAKEKLDCVITGKEMPYTIEQYAQNVIRETMGEYLSILYVEENANKNLEDVKKMTEDIIEVFRNRIRNLDWMGEKTKERAILKLDAMNIKIGAPENFRTYLDEVEILSKKEGGTFFSNLLALSKEKRKAVSSLQKEMVNHEAWDIYPFMVNACYNPLNNDITLPLAILDFPLYSSNNTYEENLGAIGYIIAHEITHAFDSIGAHFDENGNIDFWWEEDDYKEFQLLCDDVLLYYDGCEAIAAIPTDGKLTLCENVADLGAASCITELAKIKGAQMKNLYISMAKAFVSTKTRDFAFFQSKTDTHADEKLRVNKVLASIDEFYDAFEINTGDGMYVAPENRIKIW